jgi:predicted RNA binding protein YcfA (HicA-like mRNA interferase family)
MIQFLIKNGFELKRIKGNHHLLQKESLQTVIPVHGNGNLKIGTLRGVLRDIRMNPEEFEQARNV